MTMSEIRKANLDDTLAISALFRQRIEVWQRISPQGKVEDRAYSDLTLYERWLHGGAWMSVETGAIHLNHLIGRGNVVLVAEDQGAIVGYAEAYPGNEPEPFGRHLHISDIVTASAQVKEAFIRHIITLAEKQKFQHMTVSFSSYDTQSAEYYSQHRMKPITQTTRYTLSAKTGQGFYKVVENPDTQSIDGWFMPIGRLESARYHWDRLWPALWPSLVGITQQKVFRLHMNAAGHEAYILLQQQLYDSRSVDVYCWSPKPLTAQLLTALRDWTHRQNYRTLVMDIAESNAKILGADAENNPYQQMTYAILLNK